MEDKKKENLEEELKDLEEVDGNDGFEEESKEVKEEAKEETKADKKAAKKEKKSKEQERIEKLELENEKLKEEVANWKNEYLKAHADSQNFQKRINEQAIKDRKYASQGVVGNLVGPIDMLLQIVNMPAPTPEVANYQIGFQMIANQLADVLKGEGLAPINAKVGDEFNPQTMQVVETVSSEEFENNKVTKIMQPGYMYKDRLLRPAMVVVNKKEEPKQEEIKEEE